MRAIELDKRLGGRILLRERGVVVERRRDLLGKLLAELDAPLVVGVDAPDRALNKGDVLVHGNELAERVGGQAVAKDRGSRAVAGEDARGHDLLGRALGTDLVGGLTKGERFGLGEEVAEEQLVHILVAVGVGVLGVHEGDEIGRDHGRALVDELVEGVLAVGAGLAPEDLARIAGNRRAVPADLLAVGLHGELLEVGREAVQILVVGQHRVARDAKEVAVPHVQHAHERNGVLLERGVLEVLVDGVEAGEELLKALGAVHDDERETHGGVDRVAAADPAPEAKGVLGVDAKVGYKVERGGNGDEVFGDGLGILRVGTVDGALLGQLGEHPGLHLARVGERLQRGERLGDDDDERGLGIEPLDLLGHVVGVDVGDVAAVDAGVGKGLERLVDHDRAEVGATNADGDEVLDALARNTLPLTGADLLGKGVHAGELVANVCHGVLAIDHDGTDLALRATERGVQHGTVLGGVDMHAGVHLVAALLDVRGACKVAEQLHRLVGHEVLGEVKTQVVHIKGELLNALGVGGKPIFKADAVTLKGIVMGLQGRPSLRLGGIDRCGNTGHMILPCYGSFLPKSGAKTPRCIDAPILAHVRTRLAALPD